MNVVRHIGSPNVCPGGTTDARPHGRPGVACWVQNQNQNQTVVTTACGCSGYVSHSSSLCEARRPASMNEVDR